MGRLRHIAIAVPNADESARFYERAFGMKRVRESYSADQRKYVDPNGVKFDIVNGEHARNSWRLPV